MTTTVWITTHTLSIIVLMPLLLAFIIALLPKHSSKLLKITGSLGVTAIFLFALSNVMYVDYDIFGHLHHERFLLTTLSGIPIEYNFIMDGTNALLILITTLTVAITILETRTNILTIGKNNIILIFILESAIIGTLTADDLLLFYFFWSTMQSVALLLIIKESDNLYKQLPIKLFITSILSSLIILVVILFLATKSGSFAPLIGAQTITTMPIDVQNNLFWFFVISFIINTLLFSFYYLLPNTKYTADICLPAIVIGILPKVNLYVLIKFINLVFPYILIRYNLILATAAIIIIVSGALASACQKDLRKSISYFIISQTGLLILGATPILTRLLSTTILLFNYSTFSSAIFLLIGLLYKRTKTYNLTGCYNVAKAIPIFTTCSILIIIGTISIPLINNFLGMSIISDIPSSCIEHKVLVYTANVGLIINIISTFIIIKHFFWYPVKAAGKITYNDLSSKEILILLPVILITGFINIKPKKFLPRSNQQLSCVAQHVLSANINNSH